MAPINIDGTSISGITIDGQSVKEVTADGDVVWSAGLTDVSTLSYSGVSFDFSSETSSVTGHTFADGGSKLYTCDYDNGDVYQYDLSTAWDITTASYSGSFNHGSYCGGVLMKPGGGRFYVLQEDYVYKYNVSGYDISGASRIDETAYMNQGTGGRDMAWNDDGSKVFIARSGPNEIQQYSLSTNYDIHSWSYNGNYLDTTDEGPYLYGIDFNSDGSILFVSIGDNGKFYQYNLSTPYDITTATYSGKSLSYSSQDNYGGAVSFDPSEPAIYLDDGADEIFKYN